MEYLGGLECFWNPQKHLVFWSSVFGIIQDSLLSVWKVWSVFRYLRKSNLLLHFVYIFNRVFGVFVRFEVFLDTPPRSIHGFGLLGFILGLVWCIRYAVYPRQRQSTILEVSYGDINKMFVRL